MEIGNRLRFGSSDFGSRTGAESFGDARGRSLCSDGVEDFLFVDFGPGVFEITGDDRLRKIGLANDGGELAPFLT